MGLQTFSIVLNNPASVYAPGDVVSGRVLVICNSSYSAQALKIRIGGNEHVYWSDSHYVTTGTGEDKHSEYVITTYSGDEVLMECEVYLAGNGNDTFTFPAGRYEYPFRFQLPPQLPATFSSSYGSISYELQAVIKRSWYKANDKASLPITIGGVYDLNLNAGAAQPGEAMGTKTVCCLCCTSGPIVGIIRTSLTGFVPGEVIPMEVEIQNNSSRDITQLRVSLVQVIVHSAQTAYSDGPEGSFVRDYSKHVHNEVAVAGRHGVEPGKFDFWRGNLLVVPYIRPTTRGKHIIDVWYYIGLTAVVSSAGNLDVTLPVCIGTIPLRKPKPVSTVAVSNSQTSHA